MPNDLFQGCRPIGWVRETDLPPGVERRSQIARMELIASRGWLFVYLVVDVSDVIARHFFVRGFLYER